MDVHPVLEEKSPKGIDPYSSKELPSLNMFALLRSSIRESHQIFEDLPASTHNLLISPEPLRLTANSGRLILLNVREYAVVYRLLVLIEQVFVHTAAYNALSLAILHLPPLFPHFGHCSGSRMLNGLLLLKMMDFHWSNIQCSDHHPQIDDI